MGRVTRGLAVLRQPQVWIMVVAIVLSLGLWPQLRLTPVTAIVHAQQYMQPGRTATPTPTILTAANQSTATAASAVNCAAEPCLALTFDDGPNPEATPIVLQALEQAQVHASFFVVGSRAATMPGLLQRMYRDGDEIGNHSWSHPDLTTLPPDQVAAQISQTQQAVIDAGVPAPTLFRPPYGAVNNVMRSVIHMPFIMWNDDPDDWHTLNAPQVVASAEAQAKPGAIVDLHDIYVSTGQAMPQLLSDLKQHYQLVTVSQLLNLQPGQTGEFFAR